MQTSINEAKASKQENEAALATIATKDKELTDLKNQLKTDQTKAEDERLAIETQIRETKFEHENLTELLREQLDEACTQRDQIQMELEQT